MINMNRLIQTQTKNAGRSEAASVWGMYTLSFAKCLTYSDLQSAPYVRRLIHFTDNQILDAEIYPHPSLKEGRPLLHGLRLNFEIQSYKGRVFSSSCGIIVTILIQSVMSANKRFRKEGIKSGITLFLIVVSGIAIHGYSQTVTLDNTFGQNGIYLFTF